MNSLKKRFPSLSSLGVSAHELVFFFIDRTFSGRSSKFYWIFHFRETERRRMNKKTEKFVFVKMRRNFSGSFLIFQLRRERFIFSIPIGGKKADDEEEEEVGKSVFICCNNFSSAISVDSCWIRLNVPFTNDTLVIVGVGVRVYMLTAYGVSEWSQQIKQTYRRQASTCLILASLVNGKRFRVFPWKMCLESCRNNLFSLQQPNSSFASGSLSVAQVTRRQCLIYYRSCVDPATRDFLAIAMCFS